MRPTYETAAHRAGEDAVAAALTAAWGVDLSRLKPFYGVDRAIFVDGKMRGVMEIKCRNYSSTQLAQWGGLILSAHKVLAASQWHNAQRMTFVLAIGLTDGVFAMAITPEDPWPVFEVQLAGRNDRGDSQDVEPCCLIPMDRFVKVE
jgi:hypothetical protein